MKVFNAMKFNNMPETVPGSKDLVFYYQFGLTGSDAVTVEPQQIYDYTLANPGGYKLIDIETLPAASIGLQTEYIDHVRAGSGRLCMVAWYNVSPGDASSNHLNRSYWDRWANAWETQAPELVEQCDFGAISMYFKAGDDFSIWHNRNKYRIQEARRLYKDRELFVVISPNIDNGNSAPWPFVGGQIYGEAYDWAASQDADGVIEWSDQHESIRNDWDETREFVTARNARIESDNNYHPPVT